MIDFSKMDSAVKLIIFNLIANFETTSQFIYNTTKRYLNFKLNYVKLA